MRAGRWACLRSAHDSGDPTGGRAGPSLRAGFGLIPVMKITGVRTQTYEVELTRPLGDANDPRGTTHVAMSALFLDADEGLTGVSFGGGPFVHELVNRLLLGRDPRGVRGLWKRMMDYVFKGGNAGPVAGAIAAVDVALWDLKAKIDGEPLWKTLGASLRRVKAYASDIGLNLSDEALRRFYERMAERGVNAGKLKVGLDREADLRRLGIMREALACSGKTPVLMVDSNEYWSPKQAIRHIRAFEAHYDLTGWRSRRGARTIAACARCPKACGRPSPPAKTCVTSASSWR